ncbi:MAG: phage tail assembly chaperone, partial [Anaerolineales bacterium]|nr:phage tail assembly chaperone [Anaerolineales bacterium]
SNVIQQISSVEWECRRQSKGMTKPEYWAWIETITSGDPPKITYPSEDFTIIEINDENVSERLSELDSYVGDGVYNIKVYASKRDAEEILDNEGNSHDPKQYVQSHFVGQDDTRDARILAEKWANIRTRRNRELTESDWVVVKAKEEHPNASIPSDWVDYRTELRDITDQSDPDDITWPTKPS